VYLVDDGDHTVRKTTLDGTILMTLGTSGQTSDSGYVANRPHNLSTITHGAGPFNRPTRLSVAQNGELYVSDGYGNARVHRFSADGELLQSWGGPGTGAGQFNLPHSVWAHTDGRVFVCDRENDRVQIFGPTGDLQAIWTNVTRPGDLYIDRDGTVFVGEMDWVKGSTNMWGGIMPESRPAQLSVRDLDGNILTRWGGPDPCAAGSFVSPHGLWLDSQGSIYVGEVTRTSLSRFGRSDPTCHTVQKFARI
jgi:sugar lactone lactonase YvrE